MKQNVSIMPIFDLEKIADQRIGNQTIQVVLKSDIVIILIVGFKKIRKVANLLKLREKRFLQTVNCCSIFNHFYDSRTRTKRKNFIVG